MNLKDIAIEVERILIKKNISWRYVSSRNNRTFVLEDGKSTVITMRYAFEEDTYYIHFTMIPDRGVDLVTFSHLVYGVETIEDYLNLMLKQ